MSANPTKAKAFSAPVKPKASTQHNAPGGTQPESGPSPPVPGSPTQEPGQETGEVERREPVRHTDSRVPETRQQQEFVEDDEIQGISKLAKAVKDFSAAQNALKPEWQMNMEKVVGHVISQQLQNSLDSNNNGNEVPPQPKMDFWERAGIQLAANEGTPGALAHFADTVLGFMDKHLTSDQIQQGYEQVAGEQVNQNPRAAEQQVHQQGAVEPRQQTQPQPGEGGEVQELDVLQIDVEDPDQCFQVCRELGEPVTDPVAAQHLIYALQREEMRNRGIDPENPGSTTMANQQQQQESAASRQEQRDADNLVDREREKNEKLQEYLEYLEEEMRRKDDELQNLQRKEEELEEETRKNTGLNLRPRAKTVKEESEDGGN